MFRQFLLLAFLPAVALADCRFTLADQSNYYANTGFYLDLENIATAPAVCDIANLHLYLGVANGTSWQYIGDQPTWQFGHTYTARAIITPTYAELYLDGELIEHIAQGFSGLPNQTLVTNTIPGWASGDEDYQITEVSVAAVSSGGFNLTADIPANNLPIPLQLLASSIPPQQDLTFSFGPNDTLTITAIFTLAPEADIHSYAPYVDTYGQSIYSSFPGKIQADADLQAAAVAEQPYLAAWGTPQGFDQWGGVLNAGWTDTATGFFHVIQRSGVWWLISPAGNPCFYTGVDTGPLVTGNSTPVTHRDWEFAAEPPTTSPYDAAWGYYDWGNTGIASVSFDTWNMIRKYGADQWRTTATNLAVQRIQAWGFSGFGKWATETGNLPIIPVLFTSGIFQLTGSHPDIFDPAIQAQLAYQLRQQIQPGIADSRIVGWSYTNEYDGIITAQEIQTVLAIGAAVPAKVALVNQALLAIYGNSIPAMASAWGVTAAGAGDFYASTTLTPPAGDIETLRQYFAVQYYSFLYSTIKSIDPNHLYFGYWISPGWWVNASDWTNNALYVDVIGYDRYATAFEDSFLEPLLQSAGKPALVGEFSFPPTYGLTRGYRAYPTNATDDTNAGQLYQSWLFSAARNPWCVGVAWFEYRDEPVSGRGFLGETDTDLVESESYAFGLVDVTDTPKYDLVNLVRATNLVVAQHRLAFLPPVLNQGGVVNAASYAAPVAPGSLVTVFGSNLAGNQVNLSLGGVPAPLVYAFQQQIAAQVPWELAGDQQAQLTMVNDDLAGNSISVPLTTYSPGVFTVNASGSGQGAILLAGTATLANSGHPAQRGGYVSLYATGFGPVTNQPATGAPSPGSPLAETTSPVTATVGGIPATVQFAGLAPGFIGLYQINVQVPANALPGNAIPVVLSVGGVAANTVTLAVE